MRLLLTLIAGVFSAQLFTEQCFKFGIDNETKNFGGRGRRDLNSTDPELPADTNEPLSIHARRMKQQQLLGRIVNGTAANYDKWPFIAMIGFRGYGGIGKLLELIFRIFPFGIFIFDYHLPLCIYIILFGTISLPNTCVLTLLYVTLPLIFVL